MIKVIFGIFFLLTFSHKSIGFVGVELSMPQTRYTFDQTGFFTPINVDPGLEYKLFYQYRARSTLTWGASISNQHINISKSSKDPSFANKQFYRNVVTAYLSLASRDGLYFQFGVDRVATPYFYADNYVTTFKDVNRIDPFARLGSYYKTGFGGGEVSYKYTHIVGVELSGETLKGNGSELYFSLYFNHQQTLGVFFKYYNETIKNSYKHVFETRSLGFVSRF